MSNLETVTETASETSISDIVEDEISAYSAFIDTGAQLRLQDRRTMACELLLNGGRQKERDATPESSPVGASRGKNTNARTP